MEENNDTSNRSRLSQPKRSTKGKFDYSEHHCPDGIIRIADNELNGILKSQIGDYDWVVVDFGIWEIVKTWYCWQRWNPGETTLSRINHVLVRLQKLAASTDKSISVLWKTTGSSANMKEEEWDKINQMNDYVRRWFASHNPRNMYLVDWEEQVKPRSVGVNRIYGDLDEHWGLDARLLTAQMITHAVVKAQQQQYL